MKSLSKDERRTLPKHIALIEERTGRGTWDLDVAASEKFHVCRHYYAKERSGLVLAWWGHVFVNPPYSCIETWVLRAISEWGKFDGPRSITMLVPNWTDRAWWQKHIEHRIQAGDIKAHFLPRCGFGTPKDPNGTRQSNRPEFGLAVLTWGL